MVKSNPLERRYLGTDELTGWKRPEPGRGAGPNNLKAIS